MQNQINLVISQKSEVWIKMSLLENQELGADHNFGFYEQAAVH